MPQPLHEKGQNREDYLSPIDIKLNLCDAIDREAERFLRKLVFALLPLFGLLHLTNFIDRTVIGPL